MRIQDLPHHYQQTDESPRDWALRLGLQPIRLSLTTANLQKTMSEMSEEHFALFPDALIVPPGALESGLLSARLDVERLVRKLARPIKTGRRVEGVWLLRQQRRARLKQKLVELTAFVEMLEKFVNNP